MRLWIDDVRPAPNGYIWCRSVNDAKYYINRYSNLIDWDNNIIDTIELIDIDHDAGDYAPFGGDYIEILNWLEETGCNYPIRIHSANSVGIENMRRIIKRNSWKEVF